MRFSPKSDQEIAQSGLLPRGEYDYEVVGAEEAKSKSGNEMIKLKLRIYHGESERTMFDYLLESMPGKLKHFCDQNGLSKQYVDGTLTSDDCVGLSARCIVGIEKDKSGAYPDKNKIVDYVAPKTHNGHSKPASSVDEFGISDDDVPGWLAQR